MDLSMIQRQEVLDVVGCFALNLWKDNILLRKEEKVFFPLLRKVKLG